MEVISIAVLAAILVLLVLGLYKLFNGKRIDRELGKISFAESINLVNLPVITFYQGSKKLNFLLDTGATGSIINESTLKDLTYNKLDTVGYFYSAEGKRKEDFPYIGMLIAYKKVAYYEEFQVVDLSAMVGNLKQESGVSIDGILGNSFFQKYQYVLDFSELVAYSYSCN